MKIECVFQMNSLLGEASLWDHVNKKLYWVDILDNKVYTTQNFAKYESYVMPYPVTCLALAKHGGLIITSPKDFILFNPETKEIKVLASVEADLPNNRFNDGRCDRFGRFWAGTIYKNDVKQPTGILYCLHERKKVEQKAFHGRCFNGLGWSLDNKTMYVTESFCYTIFAYDFNGETAEISNRRPFITIPESSGGVPDGMAVDSQGCIWSAHPGLAEVVRYRKDGSVDQVIKIPALRPTSCCLGGENLDILYITTARELMTPDQLQQYPLSGSLFCVKVSVPGIPESFVL